MITLIAMLTIIAMRMAKNTAASSPAAAAVSEPACCAMKNMEISLSYTQIAGLPLFRVGLAGGTYT